MKMQMWQKIQFWHLVVFVNNISYISSSLLWPQFTVLQITVSVSAPVVIPKRRLFLDWGFQMNYMLPFTPANFYNKTVWAGYAKKKRSIDSDIYSKYVTNSDNKINHFDLTAGEFYMAMEDVLIEYGYHETCLLKSVCELAHHPFDLENEDLLQEVAHFVLSPSEHRAFGRDEHHYREVYEQAEIYGRNGENCNILYPKCRSSVLRALTKVIFD